MHGTSRIGQLYLIAPIGIVGKKCKKILSLVVLPPFLGNNNDEEILGAFLS